MPATSSVLSEFFARHPGSLGTSRVGGYYRVICEGCGEILSVQIPNPVPATLDIRCEHCGRTEHYGEPDAPLIDPGGAGAPGQDAAIETGPTEPTGARWWTR